MTTNRVPSTLTSLLDHPGNTRFGTYGEGDAPTNQTRLSLLLSVCGYVVRFGPVHSPILKVCGASGAWTPVRRPEPGESVREFLASIVAVDPPGRWMDANDERLTVVFADRVAMRYSDRRFTSAPRR